MTSPGRRKHSAPESSRWKQPPHSRSRVPRPTALRVDTCVCLARSEDTEKLSHSTRSQHRREILGLRQQAPGGYRPHRRRHRRRYSRGPCATRRDAGFGQPGGGIRKPRGRHRHRPPTGRLAGAGTAGCATGRRASNMRAARYGRRAARAAKSSSSSAALQATAG